MASKKHNEVMILGVVFLLLGFAMLLLNGNGNLLFGRQQDDFTSSPGRFVLLKDAEGEIVGAADIGAHERVHLGAADDPAFNGSADEPGSSSMSGFLRIYDFDFIKALMIIFFAAGSLLVLVSNIRISRTGRHY